MVLSQNDLNRVQQILLESNTANADYKKDKMNEIKLSDFYDTNRAKNDITEGEDFAVDSFSSMNDVNEFEKEFNALFESGDVDDEAFDALFESDDIDGEDDGTTEVDADSLFESTDWGDDGDVDFTDNTFEDGLLESDWMNVDSNEISNIEQLLESAAAEMNEEAVSFDSLFESDDFGTDEISDSELTDLMESVHDMLESLDEDDNEDDIVVSDSDEDLISEDDINIVGEELGEDDLDGSCSDNEVTEEDFEGATVADAIDSAEDDLLVDPADDEELIESYLNDIDGAFLESKDDKEDDDEDEDDKEDEDEDADDEKDSDEDSDDEDSEEDDEKDDDEDEDSDEDEDDEFALDFDDEEDDGDSDDDDDSDEDDKDED